MKNTSKCKVKIFPFIGVDNSLLKQYIMVDPNLIQFRPNSSYSNNKIREKRYSRPYESYRKINNLGISYNESPTKTSIMHVLSSHRVQNEILKSKICPKLSRSPLIYNRNQSNEIINSDRSASRNTYFFHLRQIKPRFITFKEQKCSFLEKELKKLFI